jgi:rhodanese-related sulfurtransferase
MTRTITAEAFKDIDSNTIVLDVRREDDYTTSSDIIPGATWKDPGKAEEWIGSIDTDKSVVIYCVRGGGVSNSVLDSMHAIGINAQFIEGGIEGLKEAGGVVKAK